MQYQSLLNSIERGVLSPVYLLYGEEDYLQEQLVHKLKEHLINTDFGDFNLDELDGEKFTPGQVVGSANTLPVFAEKRLVIVKNFYLFQPRKKDVDDAHSTPQEQPLLNYLANPLESTCLVFWVKGPVDKRRKIVKAIDKAGMILEIGPLKGDELNEWLRREAMALGKTIEHRALEYIILHADHGLRFLKGELEKLALYAGDEKTITLPMVESLLTKTSEANIFVLVDNIGMKKGETALAELRSLMGSGEPAIRILFMIARQFRLILEAKDLGQRGYTEKQITAELSLHPFVTGKILRQARNFSFDGLEKDLQRILECDVAMKTGVQARPAMEILISELCRK